MIELRVVDESSAEFAFECLCNLRGGAAYSLDQFVEYLRCEPMFDCGCATMLVGFDNDRPVGLLTVNRQAMPRYLGVSIEVEEVVVASTLRGRGLGLELLSALVSRYSQDASVRRIIVKTDDAARAGRLYRRLFEPTELCVYSRSMSRI